MANGARAEGMEAILHHDKDAMALAELEFWPLEVPWVIQPR